MTDKSEDDLIPGYMRKDNVWQEPHIISARPAGQNIKISKIVDFIVSESIKKFEEEIKKKYDLKNELNE